MELIHRNLLIGIRDALYETFFEKNKYADKVIERLLKANKKWGSQDRAIVSEIFYDIIRWKRRLEYYMGEGVKPDNLYKMILAYLLWTKTKYKKFDELQGIKISDIVQKIEKNKFPNEGIEYSIPEWLAERFSQELGASWKKEMQALNEQANIYLRVNTLKITRNQLKQELYHEGVFVQEVPSHPEALVLTERKNVFLTSAFKAGFFEVQDLGSQMIGDFVDAQPGMRIVDACAGAGGKTLHLAAKMHNKGQIIALDIFQWKLAELKRRAKRAGAFNIETRFISDSKVIKRLYDKADRVLIDAPCSGTGVLKRNPDSKWKLEQAFIQRIIEEQKSILADYSKMVKKGGRLIYATCSILPSENRNQVDAFLVHHHDFHLEKDLQILPSEGADGFYMAMMIRKG